MTPSELRIASIIADASEFPWRVQLPFRPAIDCNGVTGLLFRYPNSSTLVNTWVFDSEINAHRFAKTHGVKAYELEKEEE